MDPRAHRYTIPLPGGLPGLWRVINGWQSVLVLFQLDRIFYTSTGDTWTAGQVSSIKRAKNHSPSPLPSLYSSYILTSLLFRSPFLFRSSFTISVHLFSAPPTIMPQI